MADNKSQHKIAIVIVHGHYHTPEPYQPLVDSLKQKTGSNVAVYCPQLPGSDPQKLNIGSDLSHPDLSLGAPAGGYPTDVDNAKLIGSLVEKLVNEDEADVLLVAHSAGGWVAAEANGPELDASERKASGKKGGVVGIFFMAAMIILPGDQVVNSFMTAIEHGTILHEKVKAHTDIGLPLITVSDSETAFFHDLPPERANHYASLIVPNIICMTPANEAAYLRLPSAYLLCPADKAIPLSFQDKMITDVEARNEFQGRTITRYTAPEEIGHEPFLSWTDGVADAILQFVDSLHL